ncbi:MAG: hypothetical protein PHX83_06255 [Acidobacteriia bacterium]|nr:hypothetical protein [Terriglobia bacterium]
MKPSKPSSGPSWQIFAIAAVLLTASAAIYSPPSALAQSLPRAKHARVGKRYDTFKGNVLVFTARAITVRDEKNMNLVRTFSFDSKLLPKMQKRHYKWGDKVKVKYIRGTDTAVKIH